MTFLDIYSNLHKDAAAMLTPEAQQAAMQPPPEQMPPQGAPMDPSMGAAPMDPAMMQQGAPADPAMAAQGAPMDPSMMGAPAGSPAGQPGMWMQDQVFMQFLMSMGIQVQPDGTAVGPDGQPVPPEMMEQIYAQFQQEMAAQGGAPGMPPQGVPQEGAPMPPEGAAQEMPAEGTPEEAPEAGMPEEILNQVASMLQDIVDNSLEEKLSACDKKISAFADKLDTIKLLLDDMLSDKSAKEKQDKTSQAELDNEISKDLVSAQQAPVDIASTEAQLAAPEEVPAGNLSMLDIMRGR